MTDTPLGILALVLVTAYCVVTIGVCAELARWRCRVRRERKALLRGYKT